MSATIEELQKALGPFLVRLEAAEHQAAEATAKWEQANARAEKLQAARDRDLERYRAKVDAETRARFRANLAVELFEEPGEGGDHDVRPYQVRLDSAIAHAFAQADRFLAFGRDILGRTPEQFDADQATAGENASVLWAHLVSEHRAIVDVEAGIDELVEQHQHEHRGPGGIRDHIESARTYSLKAIAEVLSESDT